MRTLLTPENLSEFHDHFGTLHDAVVPYVYYSIFDRKNGETLEIGLQAKDYKDEEKGVWVGLTLQIENMSKLIIKSFPAIYNLGIIFSASFAFIDDKLHMSFCRSNRDPLYIEQYQEDLEQTPDFIVICEKCYWSIQPLV